MSSSTNSSINSLDEDPAPSNMKKISYLACISCGYDIEIINNDPNKDEFSYYCDNCEKKNKNGKKQMSIEEYLEKLNCCEFDICSICKKKMIDENEWKYCTICKIDLCPKCIITHINDAKHNSNEGLLINFNEKKNKCLTHPHELDNSNICFCVTHQIHLCKSCCKEHKKKRCKREFLVDYEIRPKENNNFKINIDSLEKKEQELTDEKILAYKNLEKKLKEEIKKEENKYDDKAKEYKNEYNLQLREEDDNLNISKKRLEDLSEKYEAEKKTKIENFKKEHDIEDKKIRENCKTKIKNANINSKNNLSQIEAKYNDMKNKAKNNKQIEYLNNIIYLTKLAKNVNDNYPDNCFSRMNYLFISNDFKEEEETPTPDSDNDGDAPINNNEQISGAIRTIGNENEDKALYKKKVINNNNNLPNTTVEDTNLLSQVMKTEKKNKNTLFNSLNKQPTLIYTNKDSVMCINLENDKKKDNKQNENVIDFRYFYDKRNNKDLIMSRTPNSIQIRDLNNKNKPLYNFNIRTLQINSACLFDNNESINIITCNKGDESIQIYDLSGKAVDRFKIIDNEITSIIFIDSFYDETKNKSFIIAGSKELSFSYDYSSKTLYHKYKMTKNQYSNNIIKVSVFTYKNVQVLMDFEESIIRIYDFNEGYPLYYVDPSSVKNLEKNINDICPWDNDNIFVVCKDKKILLLNNDDEIITKNYKGNKKAGTQKRIEVRNETIFISKSLKEDIEWS